MSVRVFKVRELEDDADVVLHSDVEALLSAAESMQTSSLVWYRNSGVFRHLCRAILSMRDQEEVKR